MLCSHCSEVVKPVVAIDIDGTLADYHGHFILFAATWLNKPVTFKDRVGPYTGLIPFRDWFCAAFEVDVTVFRSIKLAYRQGGMKRSQPAFVGGHQLVNTLRKVGAEVWLTTTRPHDRYDRVDPDTREWLNRHGFKYDALLFNDEKMLALSERVDRQRVVAVLDDQADILDDAVSLGLGTTILAAGEYNADVEWPRIAFNLTSAYNMINVLVEDWTRSYG